MGDEDVEHGTTNGHLATSLFFHLKKTDKLRSVFFHECSIEKDVAFTLLKMLYQQCALKSKFFFKNRKTTKVKILESAVYMGVPDSML